MGKVHQLFQNVDFTTPMTDVGRPISFTQDWLGFVIDVSNVGAGTAGKFTLQWSHDGETWFTDTTPQGGGGKKKDPPAEIMADFTGDGRFIRSTPIKAVFWRLVTDVSGTNPKITATATAMA